MKAPTECQTLEEVRCEIDRLDRQLISLVAERAGYVVAAASFKRDQAAVADPKRVEAMVAVRRAWAEEAGLSPELVEAVFRTMVRHFIEEEKRVWQMASEIK